MALKNLLTKMITRKNLDDAIANAAKGGLEKTLGVWDLIILGVGAIIGSGIFAVVGIAAAGSPDGTSPGAERAGGKRQPQSQPEHDHRRRHNGKALCHRNTHEKAQQHNPADHGTHHISFHYPTAACYHGNL